MSAPRRGEVWLTDMGIAGKVRQCLLLTDYPAEDELALITVVPHTTALRGNLWEVSIPQPFLKPGAFHLQQIQSLSVARLIRCMGSLAESELETLEKKLSERLFR